MYPFTVPMFFLTLAGTVSMTVMGLRKDFKKGPGMMNFPVFEAGQGLLSWGKKVSGRVELVIIAAEKREDSSYKALFYTREDD